MVDAAPEKVWPVLKDFWQETGFIVVSENEQTGIMETDWAENRAKIPQGVIRNLLGKVFDQAYSSPERDKFRTRLERGQKAGTTEVYISHRGMYEMYVNDANMRQTGRTVWQPRPSDPELEAEMLRRFMAKLAGDQAQQVTAQGQTPKAAEPRAVVSKASGTPVLVLKDDFDRAWRRVGLSLDRLGFSVQDRDRSERPLLREVSQSGERSAKAEPVVAPRVLGERCTQGQVQGLSHRRGRGESRYRSQSA